MHYFLHMSPGGTGRGGLRLFTEYRGGGASLQHQQVWKEPPHSAHRIMSPATRSSFSHGGAAARPLAVISPPFLILKLLVYSIDQGLEKENKPPDQKVDTQSVLSLKACCGLDVPITRPAFMGTCWFIPGFKRYVGVPLYKPLTSISIKGKSRQRLDFLTGSPDQVPSIF